MEDTGDYYRSAGMDIHAVVPTEAVNIRLRPAAQQQRPENDDGAEIKALFDRLLAFILPSDSLAPSFLTANMRTFMTQLFKEAMSPLFLQIWQI